MSGSTETDILAGLDFTPEFPCEHSDHPKWPGDPAAMWIASNTCPACKTTRQALVCNPDRLDYLKVSVLICTICTHEATPDDFQLTFRPIGDMP